MKIITIARKPFKTSVTYNVLENQCGGLNIDASRISTEHEDLSGYKPFGSMPESKVGEGGFRRPWMNDHESVLAKQRKALENLKTKGRWPSNVVLQHLDVCNIVGSVEVQSSEHRGLEQTSARSWKNTSKAGINRVGYGKETVSAWDCSKECPVHDLNSQSGVQKSGIEGWGMGTAARFFKQFKGE